jgi:hypothetical protein
MGDLGFRTRDASVVRRSERTKAVSSEAQDKLALGENEVKQSLLLMDTGQNGKISKPE